jgi:zinc protease
MWKGSGYGHMTIGSQKDLEAASTTEVKAFFDRHYVPNNAVMVIVGDVDAEQVKEKVERYFGDIPRGPEREKVEPVDHTQILLEKRYEDQHAQQPLYLLGWKTVPETHPDRHAVELLMTVLLGGESSRITRILQDEKKLVVASVPLPSTAGGGKDAGAALGAFIPVQGAKLDDIKQVVLEEVERVRKRGISKRELEKATNQVTVETISQLGTNSGRAWLIATGAQQYGDPTYVLEELETYQKVTLRDVKRVANAYLTDKWIVVEIVPKK